MQTNICGVLASGYYITCGHEVKVLSVQECRDSYNASPKCTHAPRTGKMHCTLLPSAEIVASWTN